MSDNNALAALGLDVEDAEVANEPVLDVAAESADKADREEVDVGEIAVGEVDFIPTSQRSAGGSKYKFNELKAPYAGADGKTKYSQFTVTLQPGVDEDKLKRSVQSATTQENKKSKERGDAAYCVTRTINKDGKFTAIMVIRTDVRPEKEEAEAS
jgi:hypothetical protein